MRVVGRLSPSIWGMIVPTAIAIAVALVFLGAMLNYTRGHLAPPLDDVFIYFQYARNLAHGHWFEYNVGEGFSSGATGFLYTLVLAFGYRLGVTGVNLIIYAFIFAIGTLIATACLVWDIVRKETKDEGVALLAAGLVLFNGWLLWGYFSFMEVGLEGMLIVLTLWFLLREKDKPAAPGFAVSGSLLALSRPEAMLVTLVLATMYVLNAFRRSREEGRRLPSTGVLLSAAGSLTGILVFAVNNLAGAGTLATNTFKVDSILSLPHTSISDKVSAVTDNLLWTYPTAIGNLGPPPIAAGLFLLAAVGLAAMAGREILQRRMGLGITATGAVLALQVGLSVNGWPTVHFSRYATPGVPLAAIAMAVGLWAILNRLEVPRSALLAASAALLAVLVAGLPGWARNYGLSTADVYYQQMDSGYWVHDNTPPDAVIGLNDAGALAYLGDRKVFDLIGLVTNDMADSLKHGQASTWEALERLSPEQRPTLFVVYPELFPDLVRYLFPTKVAEFPLERLTISGGVSAVAYEPNYFDIGNADQPVQRHNGWTVADGLDVADLDAEGAHSYGVQGREPGTNVAEVLLRAPNLVDSTVTTIDGGRKVTGFEEFTLGATAGRPAILVLRTASGGRLRFEANGQDLGVVDITVSATRFQEIEVTVPADLINSDRVRFRVEPERPATYQYNSFYYWLMQAPE
jgi:hypothetical protein